MDIMEKIHLTHDLTHKVLERVAKRKEKGKPEFDISEVSFTLNEMLYGLQRGKLIVIGGRPSNGKTAFMGDIAYNLAMNSHKVAFISLEMEAIDIAERITARGLEINNRDFFTGQAEVKAYKDHNKLLKHTESMKNLVITENLGFTITELNNVVTEYLSKFDVIIIDYLQMIKGSATAKENLDEYIKHLRLLAVKKNKVIILGSQINRAGTGKDGKDHRPTMADLKGTGCIEEVADVVMLCHWQYFYTKDIKQLNEYDVLLQKNRATGLTGNIKLKFEPSIYKFTETIGEKYG